MLVFAGGRGRGIKSPTLVCQKPVLLKSLLIRSFLLWIPEETQGPSHVVNAELAKLVFKLIDETNKFADTPESLELGYLFFLEQFRKVYIGEHAKQVVNIQSPDRFAASKEGMNDGGGGEWNAEARLTLCARADTFLLQVLLSQKRGTQCRFSFECLFRNPRLILYHLDVSAVLCNADAVEHAIFVGVFGSELFVRHSFSWGVPCGGNGSDCAFTLSFVQS